MHIRPETDADREALHQLNVSAFPAAAEAELVDALRAQGAASVSLVAESDGKIRGHILFSPVTLDTAPGLKLAGLAPMAVHASVRREGIGSALVKAGLRACREAGYGAAVVLGHPDYYPRFGFVPARDFDIGCEYDVPDDAFMATELEAGYLSAASGTIAYHPAFAEL
jgi:putative acetyltransferase